MNIMCR